MKETLRRVLSTTPSRINGFRYNLTQIIRGKTMCHVQYIYGLHVDVSKFKVTLIPGSKVKKGTLLCQGPNSSVVK